ncbi:helix-turn-helix domain-containing protein [Natroniella sp. ANB-PHB2]|uniref:helix-turn-helix domain-containing protein n=1 Tax=Natroniella sp. ANB-PHB2 TaxID=3384444 RepID=UPI0038D3A98C
MCDFSERLTKLIQESGKKLSDIEKDTGIDKSNLSRYKNDKTDPKPYVINKLAEYFNVSTDYLLGRTNIRNPDLEIPPGVKKFLEKEEQEFIIDLMAKGEVQTFLREARGATDKDLADVIRYFKFLKEGKLEGEKLEP